MSNAHKFVASKGLDEAKRVLENAPVNAVELRSNDLYYSASGLYWCNVNKQFFESLTPNKFLSVNLSELKQVVESVGIAKHGLTYLKEKMFSKNKTLDDVKNWVMNVNEGLLTIEGIKLKQAIADYELVEKYKGENNG